MVKKLNENRNHEPRIISDEMGNVYGYEWTKLEEIEDLTSKQKLKNIGNYLNYNHLRKSADETLYDLLSDAKVSLVRLNDYVDKYAKTNNESKSRTRKRSIKEASEVGYGEYDEFKSEITDELEGWGFEYSDDCHWDYFMPFGFYATYNARDGWAAIFWDNNGLHTEIEKYSVDRLDTPEKADNFGSKCYNFSNYDMDTLIREGLLLNGAVATREDPWVFEYTDNTGDFWVIDLRNDEADVTYSDDGSTEHLEGMWDILSACGLTP